VNYYSCTRMHTECNGCTFQYYVILVCLNVRCTLCLFPQVSVRSPTMDTIRSGVVDQDISDVGLSNALGIKKNNSAAITIEDLPRSDTTSTGVEVVTNGSVEASAYASVEGCGAQAIDKVHNQMPDKTYKLVEGKQKTKAL